MRRHRDRFVKAGEHLVLPGLRLKCVLTTVLQRSSLWADWPDPGWRCRTLPWRPPPPRPGLALALVSCSGTRTTMRKLMSSEMVRTGLSYSNIYTELWQISFWIIEIRDITKYKQTDDRLQERDGRISKVPTLWTDWKTRQQTKVASVHSIAGHILHSELTSDRRVHHHHHHHHQLQHPQAETHVVVKK